MPLAGMAAESVRVCDSRGQELLFALTDFQALPVSRGPIPSSGFLTIPVECAARQSVSSFVYFDNPSAGELPDFLANRSALANGDLKAAAGPVERLELKQVGTEPPWPAALVHRAEVRVVNLARGHAGPSQACLDLSTLEGRTHGPVDCSSLRVTLNGRAIPHAILGDRLLFSVNVPPRTAWSCYLDFESEHPGSGNRTSGREQPAGLSRFNLVRNPGIEEGTDGPDHWTNSGASAADGVTFGVDDPHRTELGRQSLRLHVPATAPARWRGWHQDIPIRAGHAYLLAAEMKCQDIPTGEVRVHAHFLQADGSLCRHDAMTSIGPGLQGTTDWTLVSGTLTAPADAALLQVHLTMEQSGTIWHDAVAAVEVTPPSSVRYLRRPDSGESVQVWQVPAVIKVFPDTVPPLQNSPARIAAAHNEKEPLQLAISSSKGRKNVRLVADPPVGPDGARLSDMQLAVVGFVPVDHATGYYQSKSPAWYRKVPEEPGQSDGWPGLWPDPLLPRDRFDLAPGSTQPVWITVQVGKDAPAGDYTGKVRLVGGEEVLATVPYTVHVWNFAIPEHSRFKAIYDISLGPGGQALWNQATYQAYPQIARAMAARRTSPNRILPDPAFRYENGRASADFTAFDKAARVYFEEWKFPHAYMPDLFYLFGWGFPPRDIFGEHPFPGDPPFEKADRTLLRAEYKRAYQACLKLFWEHVKTNGWHDRFVLYISDEPFFQQEPIRRQMKALCAMIHEVDPAIPIYSSTWRHVPDWDGSLDIWGLGQFGEVPVETMARIRTGGAKIWFTTDGQMCIDTPYCAIERLLPHYAFAYGAEAYEFWGIAWLTHDPYRFGWHAYIPQTDQPGQSYWIRYPNGDGFLLYPGKPIGAAGPVSSIRLEQAREGVEDYEYLHLLRDLVDREKAAHRECPAAQRALEGARLLVPIPNAGGRYSTKILPDPDAVYRVRQALGEAIESLSDR